MSDQEKVEKFLSKLTPLGMTIGDEARKGKETAQKVMQAYDFWHKCPGDMMAFMLCEKAFEEWEQEQQLKRSEA